MNDNTIIEPTLFGAIWRYRWLSAIIVAAAMVVALVYTTLFPPMKLFTAEASLVVQDTGGGLDLGTSGQPQRFVANQVEILQSGAVMQLAIRIAAESEVPVSITIDQYLDDADVRASQASDLVEVTFAAEDPTVAITGTNSLVAAYLELISFETSAAVESALERIDTQLAIFDDRLNEADDAIAVARQADPIRARLDQQLIDELASLVELQDAIAVATGSEVDALQDQLTGLRLQIDTYRLIQVIEIESDDVGILLAERQQILDRRATLLERRDQVGVDAVLAGNVVAFQSLAQAATESPAAGPLSIALIGALLGALVAGASAYLLASRVRRFHERREPAAVLGVPLLSDIPDFADEGIKSRLPVAEAPRAVASEAYRFAAGAIERRFSADGISMLAVVSSTLGSGKSTAAANTALAAAREGRRVLVIDADFGNQGVTSLLTNGAGSNHLGLTDVIEAGVPLEDALQGVTVGGNSNVWLMSRGRQPSVAANLLRTPEARAIFEAVKPEFDLIVVDVPPLLQVAYGGTLLEYVDASLVVVRHGSPVAEVEEVHERLRLADQTIIGYLYNRSPLRREMMATEGSMADVIGDRPLTK